MQYKLQKKKKKRHSIFFFLYSLYQTPITSRATYNRLLFASKLLLFTYGGWGRGETLGDLEF